MFDDECREPVAYRYKHEGQEHWRYGDKPSSCPKCQPAEPLYLAPPPATSREVPDGWQDAIIAMCAAWAGADDFVRSNFSLLGDAVLSYPVVQGTVNQLTARRIGLEKYDGKVAAQALKEIHAMLAAAPAAPKESQR